MVVESFDLEEAKTKAAVGKLKALGLTDVLVITEGHDEKLSLSVRNLHWAAVIDAGQLNPVSLLAYEQVLVTSAALKLIEVRLTGAKA